MTVEAPTPDEVRTDGQALPEGKTEAIEPVARAAGRPLCPDPLARPTSPGRYLEIRDHLDVRLVPLEAEIVRIGRSLSSDVRLEDASISRRHAIVVSRPNGARVLDDRSSNGVRLNGRRVAEADLADGDVIALGHVVIRYLDV